MLQEIDNNEWKKGTNFALLFVDFSNSLLCCRSPQLQRVLDYYRSLKKVSEFRIISGSAFRFGGCPRFASLLPKAQELSASLVSFPRSTPNLQPSATFPVDDFVATKS
jgi:hypothetical protein